VNFVLAGKKFIITEEWVGSIGSNYSEVLCVCEGINVIAIVISPGGRRVRKKLFWHRTFLMNHAYIVLLLIYIK
jgi:hypothetical protein